MLIPLRCGDGGDVGLSLKSVSFNMPRLFLPDFFPSAPPLFWVFIGMEIFFSGDEI